MKTTNFNVKTFNFSKIKHIHFIGIGGISVSGLAKFCLNKGIFVSGSDITNSHLTKELQSLGAIVFIGHSEENIKTALNKFGKNSASESNNESVQSLSNNSGGNNNKSNKISNNNNDNKNTAFLNKTNNLKVNNSNNSTLVVYSGAISNNNQELLYAKNNNIKTLERSDFLGLIASTFKNVVSVSGTHGKTSTTAIIGHIFIKAGLSPTIHLGGEVANSYNNFLIGGNDYFITEACEYKKSFESLHSTHSVITNIGKDHMDCYVNEKDLHNSFNTFANQTKSALVANRLDAHKINTKTKTIFCGEEDNELNNYTVKNITSNELGKHSFSVYHMGKKLEDFSLNVMGKYNVYNALYAIVIARLYNIDINIIKQAVAEFEGIKRRNEFMGEFNGIPVYADYAHHPTEIEQSLNNYKNVFKNVLLVFQPHTYSRTKTLMPEFVNCFNSANNLVMFKTYPAREEYDFEGSENNLFNNINFNKNHKKLAYSLEQLPQLITESISDNNVILFLGAGNLYNHINKIIS